jgi:single-strand DNA-binding protein
MANFNKVILAGNLTRDPELRYTPKGTAIAKFGLAINRTYTAENGERKDETTFVDIDAFGKQAELIGQYFRKGRPILIEGRLKLDTWEDKQSGQKRSKLGVVLDGFQFMDSRSGEPGAPGSPGAAPGGAPGAAPYVPAPRPARPAPASPPPPSAPAGEDGPPPEDDDVPF